MTPKSQTDPPVIAAPAPVTVTVYGPGGTKATGHGMTRGEARRAAQVQPSAGSSSGGDAPPSEGLGVLGWILLAEVLLPVWLWPLLIATSLVTGGPSLVVQPDVWPLLYLLTIPPTLALWAAGGALRRRLRRPGRGGHLASTAQQPS